jgi:hypothetical protein
MLIEMKKHEIVHHGKKTNPLTSPIRVADSALSGINCLYYVSWHNKNAHITVSHKTYEFVQLQQMLGIDPPILMICQDCIEEKGFTTATQERCDNMDQESFFKIAGILGAIVSPEIEQAAMRELIESN